MVTQSIVGRPQNLSERGLGTAIWKAGEGCVLKLFAQQTQYIYFDHIFTCGDFEGGF